MAVFLFLISMLTSFAQADMLPPPNLAWHLKVTVPAKDKKILGIPVQELHRDLVKASIFTEADFQNYPDATRDLKENRARFTVDIKRGKETHKAVVGAYATNTESGGFLLVVKKDKGNWKKLFFEKMKRPKNFSMLSDRGPEALLWCECLFCDGCQLVKWNERNNYTLESLAGEYDH
jgi:hypothetical protein